MLSPYRVLDLTTERGLLCGQILADLGADVVKVEPPGGAASRWLGPFYQGRPHPERSLLWWAFNRDKRSVTLDLDQPQGREILLRLAEKAHFLIESEDPGHLAAKRLGYQDVSVACPSLVYVSITPFGQEGPKADYAASDLIVLAAGGPLVLTGDDDRPPVRVSVPQAFLHASSDAAVGALVAHFHRQSSGHGQHVDVSAQQSVALATQANLLSAQLGDAEFRRSSGGAWLGPIRDRFVFPARDGWVAVMLYFGPAIGPYTRRLMEWICEEGACDEATRDKDWENYQSLLLDGVEPIEEFERVKLAVESFTSSRTTAELFAEACRRKLLIAPVAGLAELLENEQLDYRGYWRDIELPELARAVRFPGPFAKFSVTPITARRPPPRAGEHNREIYAEELGISGEEMKALEKRKVI